MKKQIKNLKQFRKFKTRAKFQFYVVFRPVAQKWFFVPLLILVIFLGIKDWYVNRGEWSFENPTVTTAEALTVRSEVIETSSVSDSYTDPAVVIRGTSEIVKSVAKEEGIDWKILMALFLKETQGNCNREGDKDFIKPSWGCYQINKHYHPEVTWEQATDIEWSSRWTANRLKAKAEKFGWDNAIAMHNGSPKNPVVQSYLSDVKKIIESL